ncbi:MAG: glycosyltransferase family 2 protein [Planctomycetia bacterium]|nr:glycosyltransferase family 2 protein [Planctomycetia bacterium]
MTRFLTALPVYNEHDHVNQVLDQVVRYATDVLVVDDGSTDGTSKLLAERQAQRCDISVIRHETNRGYGAALATAFAAALAPRPDGSQWAGLVTIDCDGQHQPQLIPSFIAAVGDAVAPRIDIVSGSRYLKRFPGDSQAPESRRQINQQITAEINQRLGLSLTDAFCGFKAYSRQALLVLPVTESGYAMPLEVWVLAAAAGLVIEELPVPLVYLDASRSFGGSLDDAATRLAHYRVVLDRAARAVANRHGETVTLGYGGGPLSRKVDA